LVKIYEVKFNYELDEEEKQFIREHNGMDEDEEIGMATGIFHVGEMSVLGAAQVAEEKAEEMYGDGYEILSVEELEDMTVVNWGECNCPYCKAEFAAPDDLVEFDCTCGEHIKVADGWKKIICYKCDRIIDRNDLIGSNGNYTLVSVDDSVDKDSGDNGEDKDVGKGKKNKK
jgi:hypothetical protein